MQKFLFFLIETKKHRDMVKAAKVPPFLLKKLKY